MPPWFANPKYGHFANDRSLTKSEIDTIVDWVDAGAAEGNPKDAPPARAWPAGWSIGTPDVIFEMPEAFAIPGQGTVEYQYVILPTQFTEDKWVERVEVRPSERSVVHHAVVYIREQNATTWLRNQPIGAPFSLPATNHRPNPASLTTSDILMVYTPGNSSDSWLGGMAKRIKAGSDLVLQMHYTPNGKAVADRTRIGVVFAKQPPKQAVLTLQMGNDKFVIPAGDSNYKVAVSGTLPNEATLIGLFPHMHLRGKGFEYLIVESGGKSETLLKIDRYDFNWQLNYQLAQPRVLPAGTRLQWIGYFANSPNNPKNPDFTAELLFGEQSWEKMIVGFFDIAADP